MKLKNKKTGEIIEATIFYGGDDRIKVVTYTLNDGRQEDFYYRSLKELNAEWEDYEEPKPKQFWYINSMGLLFPGADLIEECVEETKKIGNYFSTKEEAEKAVEKLKAWKRLKDKGFRFKGYTDDSGDLFSCQVIRCSFDDFGKESRKDLDLLFGGEE